LLPVEDSLRAHPPVFAKAGRVEEGAGQEEGSPAPEGAMEELDEVKDVACFF
jgi:hypothetical protein